MILPSVAAQMARVGGNLLATPFTPIFGAGTAGMTGTNGASVSSFGFVPSAKVGGTPAPKEWGVWTMEAGAQARVYKTDLAYELSIWHITDGKEEGVKVCFFSREKNHDWYGNPQTLLWA
jgi:hypothetical protein